MRRPALFLVLLALSVRPAAAAEVRLDIAGGFVTLTAVDAPLRQILAAERVGGLHHRRQRSGSAAADSRGRHDRPARTGIPAQAHDGPARHHAPGADGPPQPER
jgi:hypothetical protein